MDSKYYANPSDSQMSHKKKIVAWQSKLEPCTTVTVNPITREGDGEHTGPSLKLHLNLKVHCKIGDILKCTTERDEGVQIAHGIFTNTNTRI